ncbi:MAG: sporulation protein YtfJ [Firmicutes bacterium]|nr:sporulation protein YtfJ [Bacillota bacterium]
MDNHPIQGMMKTVMESMKEMVDVNTIVGDPVETADGSVIMPISRVAFGYAAGGSEFVAQKAGDVGKHPFGGGSGAGVSVQPVGFLVVGNGHIRMLPVDTNSMIDRLVDVTPQLINQIQGMVQARRQPPPQPTVPTQIIE